MKGTNQSTRCRWEFGGGGGTGRFDRGEDVSDCGAVVLADPVSQGDIETHALRARRAGKGVAGAAPSRDARDRGGAIGRGDG